MRKLFCLIILFLCFSNLSYSNPVDSVMARKVALNLYGQISSKQILSLNISFVERSQDGTPVFYVFNINEAVGFVLVPAEHFAYPIFRYSDKGHFVISDISTQLICWIEEYTNQV